MTKTNHVITRLPSSSSRSKLVDRTKSASSAFHDAVHPHPHPRSLTNRNRNRLYLLSFLHARRKSTLLRCNSGAASTMAGHLKRRRGPVSYKEPSSDVDHFDDSDEATSSKQHANPQRRSTRQHRPLTPEVSPPSRKKRAVSPNPVASTRGQKKTVELRGRRRISYRETTSDEDEDFGADSDAHEGPSKAQPRKKARSSRSKDKKAKRQKSRPFGGPAKTKTGM
jgi:hypothetical protein